jgi:hypothetical protein
MSTNLMSRPLLWSFLFLVTTGCVGELRQPIQNAIELNTGMSMNQVSRVMGEPALRATTEQVTEWHYCSTGTQIDRMVAIFFVDGRLRETLYYSVSLSQAGGITGSCDNFLKMGGYVEPDYVIRPEK